MLIFGGTQKDVFVRREDETGDISCCYEVEGKVQTIVKIHLQGLVELTVRIEKDDDCHVRNSTDVD